VVAVGWSKLVAWTLVLGYVFEVRGGRVASGQGKRRVDQVDQIETIAEIIRVGSDRFTK
jgi:hypothetical protein